MNISSKICGINFPNLAVVASGYLGVTGSSLANCINQGAGAVTSKTLFMDARLGNPNPSVLTFNGGIISSIGMGGEGIKNSLFEFNNYKKLAPNNPIIGSVGGNSLKEFIEVAEIMDTYPVDMIELNFCCPCDKQDDMPISYDPNLTLEAVKAIRKVVKKPITVKLSPNAHNIGLVAKNAEEGGADAITAINSVGPGMLIDISTRMPILGTIYGGVSGMAIKPIALRCVYDIYKSVKIPIIGTGGITNGKDAIEMIMAGASLLGIGSAIIYQDLKCFNLINDKVKEYMTAEGFNDISEIVGIAHRR